ncbi:MULTISPECIES: TolB family protein [Deinococcus]|uniref:WD40-like repeat/amidohydrolase domain protein n=2 Tax=Deinococcus TaxID=1298 RepID=H8H3F0_DEIGI|nr:PD40 domain-containing protein [Deinococcus gobiensis]AFD28047.1 WD40-like repeat/amidohydrolase domain protein [Deinococcus gobiensis I-0]
MLYFHSPQALTSGSDVDLRANWSPDGHTILFERLQGGRRHLWNICLKDRQESIYSQVNLPSSNSTGRAAFLTPEEFVFVSDQSGQSALYLSHTGVITSLYAPEQACHGPAFGANGHWPMLFFQQADQNEYHIYKLEEDGQAIRLTSGNTVEDQPWPLPDGKTFVYHAQVENQHLIYHQAISPDATPICLSIADEGTAYVTPFPSPDGTWIAFTSAQEGSEQIWIMRVDGTERQQITFGEPHSFPAWSPDGQMIVCTQGQPTAKQPTGKLILLRIS